MHSDSAFSALLDFLDSLNAGHIAYRLRYSQPRTISVDVDFFEDGVKYVEKFVRQVTMPEAEVWTELQNDIKDCITETKGTG